jgi:hypothetical protein
MKIKKDTHIEVDANEIVEALKLKGIASDFSMSKNGDVTTIRFSLREYE